MQQQYSFRTRWVIQASLEEVWKAILESEAWPGWWNDVLEVREIREGDDRGIGSIRLYTLKSPMGYKLRFHLLLTVRTEGKLLQGIATGDLEGTGSWHFSELSDNQIEISCLWQVSTRISWMNALAFLLGPVFRYNHAQVMKRGARALAKKLNAPLLSY